MYNVGVFLFNDIELLDFAGPYEVFSVTAELNDYQLFKVFSISEDGQAVKTVNGLRVTPDYSFRNHPPIDILVVPGGVGTKAEMEKDDVRKWLRANFEASLITMSVCSGARLLGKLGLLDNIDATTHHEVIPELEKIASKAIIKADVRYTDNGQVMTAAGISAGIDLALHVVDKLYGREIADKSIIYMEYGQWETRRRLAGN
jgi:transcriptional regulator GlxA family with amidase domain